MAAIIETWADGDAFTAGDANTYLMRQSIIACDNQTDRDAILTPQEGMTVFRKDLNSYQTYDGASWYTHSGQYPIGCKAIRSSTISIPNATETTVTWNSEEYDSGTMHDNTTNAERIVVPEAGTYSIDAFAAFATGVAASAIRLYKNGSSLGFYYMPGSVTGFGEVSAHRVEKLAANDYIHMQVFQSSGAAKNLTQSQAYLAVIKL